MARRKARVRKTPTPPLAPMSDPDLDASDIEETLEKAPAHVLVAHSDAALSQAIIATIADGSLICRPVSSLGEARRAVEETDFDLVIADFTLPDGSGIDLLRSLHARGVHTKVALCAAEPSLEDALAAMRAGAIDLIPIPFKESDLVASVTSAIDLARLEQGQARRVVRLQRICKRLNSSRRQVTSQVDSLCNDLVGAYHELSDQVSQVAIASEFNALIRQELDIEALLRTALEFLLTRTGPTNAAVFLPSDHSDYSLGAYVNYDCPRDTADVLLDHLADVIAPRFAEEQGVHLFTDHADLAGWIGDDANWLADSDCIVFSSRHDGECLAVTILFRDRSTPFPADLAAQLDTLSGLFAEQLARIVRIHHRRLPDNSWSGWDDEWEEEGDGFGGMAA